MSAAMPPVKQSPSPNYSPTLIAHDLIVVHRTEGNYAGSVNWLCDPRAKASAHLVMKADGSEVTQLVPLSMKAWAQCAFNGKGLSLEIEGFTRDGFGGDTARAAARIVAWLCREYGIPPIWARGGQGRGVCQHHDLGAAGGGHVDCSGVGSPEWMGFLELVKDAFDELGPNALPEFALHGLPDAQAIAVPSDAAPTPSHSGAMRAEAADNASASAHSTASGFPDGSTADLQWRLNKAGAAPALAVDGHAGAQTKAAIAAFQGQRRLFVDGVAGPKTWASLRAATP